MVYMLSFYLVEGNRERCLLPLEVGGAEQPYDRAFSNSLQKYSDLIKVLEIQSSRSSLYGCRETIKIQYGGCYERRCSGSLEKRYTIQERGGGFLEGSDNQ